MDYSKIPFKIIENTEIFPGKLSCLSYPAADKDDSVFIYPICFSLSDQAADSTYFCRFCNQKVLFYCLGGDGRIKYQNHSFSFTAGKGFFLNGDHLSEIISGEEGAQYTLYLMNGDLAEELQKIAGERNAICFDSDQFQDFEQRQFLLIRSFPGKLYDKEYDFSCHMNHLLVRLLQLKPEIAYPENDNHRQMIQQALTFMQSNFSENINIKDLAAHFNYSSSQFQKCFQEQTHNSVKQYLIRIRMQEAEKMLINTGLPVEEVCTRCGFNNANHFIRVFRQYYKKTPLQYRKENRKIQGS